LELLPITVALTDGAIREEWTRFAEIFRGLWASPIQVSNGLPPPQWEGILLTESSVLLPRLRQLQPEMAELQAAGAVLRVSSHEAAMRLLAQQVPLAILPGDSWFHWVFPDQGHHSEIYGYRDIGESLAVSVTPVPGYPEYGRFLSEDRMLPELLADYLQAALA